MHLRVGLDGSRGQQAWYECVDELRFHLFERGAHVERGRDTTVNFQDRLLRAQFQVADRQPVGEGDGGGG